MKVKIEYFAIYRDLLGLSSEDYEFENEMTIKELFLLKTKSLEDRESLLESTNFAVNGEYEASHYILKNNDEIVFIPPVSGG